MDSLPEWALWIVAVGVGLSSGLALFMVRPIARLLHRALWPRREMTAQRGRGTGAPKTDRHFSSASVRRQPGGVDDRFGAIANTSRASGNPMSLATWAQLSIIVPSCSAPRWRC